MRLSPSALSVFKSCPRCWWNEKKLGIKRPRGIFSSLPNAMDKVIKEFFDKERPKHTVQFTSIPILITGFYLFQDQVQLNRWRNWRTGLVATVGEHEVFGAMDDLLYDPETKKYAVLDYKTKGGVPDVGYSEKYYQLQADCYALMLEQNNMPVEYACFAYFSPLSLEGIYNLKMNLHIQTIPVSPVNAVKVVEAATACLEGLEPYPSKDCEYCKFIQSLNCEYCKFTEDLSGASTFLHEK